MELGTALLSAVVVLSVVSALSPSSRLPEQFRRTGKAQRVLAIASFAFVSLALTKVIWSSLSSDFTYSYVWEHSSSELASVYKLSAVWAGGAGSLLLCTWSMSFALVIEIAIGRRRSGVSQGFVNVFVSAMSLLVAFFSLTVLLSGMFDRTTTLALAAHPNGLGMDILLQTPEMVVHAPLIFGAYAAMSVLFASAVSYHLTGDALWHMAGLPWARLAWLLLTAGIGLGAVWAYYVIGWGGYWSWDPVETSSLIPWFLVTAFLHTQLRHARQREYPVASPLLGMLAVVGVVFVSFVVRAGGLWPYSVHDYGAPLESSAASRLLSLLRDEPSIMGILIFMVFLLALALTLSLRTLRREPIESHTQLPMRFSEYITDRNNMSLAVTLLVTAALLAATLMFLSIESDQLETAHELNQKMSVLFVAIMVVMSLCLTWRLLGKKRALTLSVALVASSVGLAIVGAVSDDVDGLVAFALPSFLCAVVASAVRLLQSVLRGPPRRRIHGAGANVAHLGVALLLTAFVVSANLQTFPSEGSVVAVEPDSRIVVGDYVVRLVRFEATDQVEGYPAGVVEVRAAVIDVYRSGELIEDDARLEILYGQGPSESVLVLESVAFVRSSFSEDLYLSFEWMSSSSGLLHAKVVPMMAPLWTGLALLLAGLGMRVFTAERGSQS